MKKLALHSQIPLRQAAKQDAVAAELRRQIIAAKYGPGAQLPPHLLLAKHFQVSVQTVQMGLNRLVREGFVESRPRCGTFVSQKLPHLTNYALVFWNDPVTPSNWSRYYMALTNTARAIEREQDLKITLFYGIDQHADNEDRERLLQLIRTQRLAGLIFVNECLPAAVDALLQDHHTPCVALTTQQVYPHIPVVSFDNLYFDKAMAYLAGQGRRRIAYLGAGIDEGLERCLMQAAANTGVECPPYWQQMASLSEPTSAHHCVQLLMRGEPSARPNGLIIADDNLVEQVLAGVVKAGVNVPSDLEIVAHCNFPWPPASVLPVKRLGYDIRTTLLQCIEIIDRQRRGETVPGATTIPAIFEEALPAPIARGTAARPALAVAAYRKGEANL